MAKGLRRRLASTWWAGPKRRVVVAVAVGGFVMVTLMVARPRTDLPPGLETVAVKRMDLGASTEAGGVVNAVRRVNLSPNSSSRIERLYIKEGDQVRAGQLVAEMESDQLRAKLNQAWVQLEAAQATAQAASARRQRHEELMASGAISLDLMEELRNEERQARIKVEEGRYLIQEQNAALRNTKVFAPFSGIITRLYAQAGQFVTPTTAASEQAGATSSSIAELSSGLEVVAKLSEASLTEISVGQRAEITTDAFPNQVFKGRVVRLSPRAVTENEVNAFPITVAIEEGMNRFKPAMNVQVRFIANPVMNALVIPVTALTASNDDQRGVLKWNSDGKISYVKVTTGRISGDQAQILDGVNLGDRVLVSAPPEGMKIPGYEP